MKRPFSILIFIICLQFVQKMNSQTWITIPDTAFAAYLRATIPTAMNGNHLDTSNILVTTTTHTLILGGHGFSNLYGLQYFSSLTYLDCSINPNPCLGCISYSFTTLPVLPNTLIYLDCSGNCDNLTSLPALPSSLQILKCEFDCHITSLPPLPNSLTALDCGSCGIYCFPTFPNSITSLNIESNPFNCLPNYLSNMNAATLAYPLCAAGNANGCPVSVAGIEQFESSNVLNIYPNPASYILHVSYPGSIKAITLVDVLGNIVLNTPKTNIDVSGLANGVYFINLQTNEGILTKKVIVQR